MYEVFEKLMRDRGVSAYRVAKDTGITQTSLSNWKNGKSSLNRDNLQKLADYFGVSVDYLMTGEEKEGYYLNEETAKMAQRIFENRGLRTLFDAAWDSKPENLQLAAEMLERLKGTNPDA